VLQSRLHPVASVGGFPSTQRYYRRFLLFIIHLTAVNCVTSRKVTGSRPDNVNFFLVAIYLVLPATLGPRVHSASNRNGYQKQKNNVSGE
jgi:hypothetical protein